jgi:hypothetical protein
VAVDHPRRNSVLNAIPISKILGRVGLNKWWTIAFLVPFRKYRGVVDFAHARWPHLIAPLDEVVSKEFRFWLTIEKLKRILVHAA